jgi:hypothetical protein
MRIRTFTVALLVAISLAGCSEPSQAIYFQLSDGRPEYELSYFPIVERDGKVYTVKVLHKTADASGYHWADVTAKHPDALSAPWRSYGLSSDDRCGIVILESDAERGMLLDSARVFWLDIPDYQYADREIYLTIPDLGTLPAFDTSEVVEGT